MRNLSHINWPSVHFHPPVFLHFNFFHKNLVEWKCQNFTLEREGKVGVLEIRCYKDWWKTYYFLIDLYVMVPASAFSICRQGIHIMLPHTVRASRHGSQVFVMWLQCVSSRPDTGPCCLSLPTRYMWMRGNKLIHSYWFTFYFSAIWDSLSVLSQFPVFFPNVTQLHGFYCLLSLFFYCLPTTFSAPALSYHFFSPFPWLWSFSYQHTPTPPLHLYIRAEIIGDQRSNESH